MAKLIPDDGQVIWNTGHEFVVTDVRVTTDAATGEQHVRYVGTCTLDPSNDTIRHLGYNGAVYGHKVGWRTY